MEEPARKTLTVETKLHRQIKTISKATGIRIADLVDQLVAAALKARAGRQRA